MPKKIDSRERRPRLSGRISKVPLTFYRSGSNERMSQSNPSPFKSAKPTKKNSTRNFLARTLDTLLLIMLLTALGYSLFVSPKPNVQINSEAYNSKIVYEQAATREFEQLKNRTKFTLDERQIVSSLQKQFPEISNARVELPLFSQTPKIHINIAKASFALNSRGILYIVNSQGVAVSKAEDLPKINSLKLPVLTDETGFEASESKQVLSEGNVSFINTVIVQCKKAGIPVQGLNLPPLAQELALRTSDRPYYVKFYLGGDVSTQLGQYIATRKQLDQQNIQPTQYLDVRVNGKVFYK